MQKIFVTGFVGRDPEEKFTASGKKVTAFSIGINAKKGGEKLTIWYTVNCWGDSCCAVLPYVKKGNGLTVVGDLNPPTTYQNKAGDISIDMSITCQSIHFSPSSQPKEEKEGSDPFDFGEDK